MERDNSACKKRKNNKRGRENRDDLATTKKGKNKKLHRESCSHDKYDGSTNDDNMAPRYSNNVVPPWVGFGVFDFPWLKKGEDDTTIFIKAGDDDDDHQDTMMACSSGNYNYVSTSYDLFLFGDDDSFLTNSHSFGDDDDDHRHQQQKQQHDGNCMQQQDQMDSIWNSVLDQPLLDIN